MGDLEREGVPLRPFDTQGIDADAQKIGQAIERLLPDGTRLNLMVGDATGDGYVDEEDLELLKRLLADTEEARQLQARLSPAQLAACDINGDGVIDVRDLLVLCHRLVAEMKAGSLTDPLTGLDNRRAFQEKAALKLKTARRYKIPVCAIVVDLDYFKEINQTYGQAAGDAFLVRVAQVLRRVIRESDLVCRYGGDEFVILLDHADLRRARHVVERLQEALRGAELITSEGSVVRLSVSMGVASYRPGSRLVRLLRDADHALYEARRAGPGQVGYLEPPPTPDSPRK